MAAPEVLYKSGWGAALNVNGGARRLFGSGIYTAATLSGTWLCVCCGLEIRLEEIWWGRGCFSLSSPWWCCCAVNFQRKHLLCAFFLKHFIGHLRWNRLCARLSGANKTQLLSLESNPGYSLSWHFLKRGKRIPNCIQARPIAACDTLMVVTSLPKDDVFTNFRIFKVTEKGIK